ncbi:hypothetical protein [Candidatus Burkholderia verschuerenii]|uniref:hypothetical protein n=1 Tax=Candidatus Burkholderia verschuerenii TaxID=242163 RepID=UPI0012ED280B|nr:hypothetical protein [Candidatus Burkholderia verschuerenii]
MREKYSVAAVSNTRKNRAGSSGGGRAAPGIQEFNGFFDPPYLRARRASRGAGVPSTQKGNALEYAVNLDARMKTIDSFFDFCDVRQRFFVIQM